MLVPSAETCLYFRHFSASFIERLSVSTHILQFILDAWSQHDAGQYGAHQQYHGVGEPRGGGALAGWTASTTQAARRTAETAGQLRRRTSYVILIDIDMINIIKYRTCIVKSWKAS